MHWYAGMLAKARNLSAANHKRIEMNFDSTSDICRDIHTEHSTRKYLSKSHDNLYRVYIFTHKAQFNCICFESDYIISVLLLLWLGWFSAYGKRDMKLKMRFWHEINIEIT